MNDKGPTPKKILPFLRKVFLSKRELRFILKLLRKEAEKNPPPWKEKLVNKIDKHLQKTKSYGRKKREDDC
tara:strand:+ start:1003 stop:1215 length:213 start_codon:yes stop_codon:yes gene_type:complete